MTALQILLLVALLSVAALAFLLARAPSGYEDEQGFHFGKPDRAHRSQLSDFEPVERWLTFPALVYSLGALAVFAIVALLVWRSWP